MKIKFLKPLVVVAMAASFWACSDESSSSAKQELVVSSDAWHLVEDGNDYIIYPGTNVVTDASGNVIGTFAPVEGTTGAIVNMDGVVIVGTVDLAGLEVVHPSGLVPEDQIVVNAPAWHIIDGENDYIVYPEGFLVADAYGNVIGTFEPSAEGATTGKILDANGKTIVKSVDLASATILEPKPVVPESSSSIVETENQPLSSSVETQEPSSSSIERSSSSSAIRSSSSSKITGSAIEYISGGKSGSGYATRYWDCCKPHCAWPDKGGLRARTCDAKGNQINDDNSVSMCDGGEAGICRSQFPIVVNDTLAYAFAATPGGEDNCGRCFDLAFTGKGKYATDNHTKLKGKHLIVISSNIGYDVAGGQFDVMIPGGGFGIFDGCSAKMGWGSQGARYGGLLTECEESSGYKANTYKSCLTNKCNASFANDPEAKEGCLFLANWMNASGNPLLEYKEVKCPQALLDKF